MTRINEKLGMRPNTRKRAATHATALTPTHTCPHCDSRHVLKTQSTNGRALGAFWCGGCSHFFD